MSKVFFGCETQGLVGDFISCVPFILHLSSLHDEIVIGSAANQWAANGIMWPKNVRLLPSIFAPDPSNHKNVLPFTPKIFTPGKDYQIIDIPVGNCLNHCASSRRVHMSQCYFDLFGMSSVQPPHIEFLPPPEDFQIPHSPYYVIAPFTRSDYQGNKLWSPLNWMNLIEKLPGDVYVLGGSKFDDKDLYCYDDNIAAVHPYFDHSLPEVLGLIQGAKAVFTVDTGISHLCRFARISQHVLICGRPVPLEFITTDVGTVVCKSRPDHISVADVMWAADQAGLV